MAQLPSDAIVEVNRLLGTNETLRERRSTCLIAEDLTRLRPGLGRPQKAHRGFISPRKELLQRFGR
jgi:hypothetical protein